MNSFSKRYLALLLSAAATRRAIRRLHECLHSIEADKRHRGTGSAALARLARQTTRTTVQVVGEEKRGRFASGSRLQIRHTLTSRTTERGSFTIRIEGAGSRLAPRTQITATAVLDHSLLGFRAGQSGACESRTGSIITAAVAAGGVIVVIVVVGAVSVTVSCGLHGVTHAVALAHTLLAILRAHFSAHADLVCLTLTAVALSGVPAVPVTSAAGGIAVCFSFPCIAGEIAVCFSFPCIGTTAGGIAVRSSFPCIGTTSGFSFPCIRITSFSAGWCGIAS